MSVSITEQLPHRRMEAWKWTDVRGQTSDKLTGLSVAGLPKVTAPDGVALSMGAGQVGDHVMSKIAQSFAPEAVSLYVPKGVKPAAPVEVTEIGRGHSRIALMVDEGAELLLIEHHRADSGAFVNMDVQIHLAKGAKLTRVIVQDDPDTALRVATACVSQQTGSGFNQFTLGFGGALTRLETQIYAEGEGTHALLNGAYLLDGPRHIDMTSHMRLKQPDSVIRQSVKGVVFDKARGVFQGKFHVERPAQKTDAEMRHDALLMSDRAEVRAKPELEIYADDVECAHGNTVGALDDSALFYMRQRGIPLSKAKSLLIEAFLVGVFDDLADEDLRGSLTEKVRDWLEAKL